MPGFLPRFLGLCLAVGVSWSPALAVEQFTTRLARLAGEGWTASDVVLGLRFAARGRLTAELEIAELALPGLEAPLREVAVHCHRLELQDGSYRCRDGSLRVGRWRGETWEARLSFDYSQRTGEITAALDDLGLAAGRVRLRLDFHAGQWRIQAAGKGLALEQLATYLDAELVSGIGIQAGQMQLEASVSGDATGIDRFAADIGITELGFSNATGLVAAEQGVVDVNIQAALHEQRLEGRAKVAVRGGAFFVDPVFEEFDTRPLTAAGGFSLDPASRHLALTEGTVSQRDSFQARFRDVRLALSSEQLVERAEIVAERVVLDTFYPTYVAPWLAGTSFSDLGMDGALNGRIRLRDNAVQAFTLALDGVDWRDPAGRLNLTGLSGRIGWDAAGKARRMPLRWQSGSIYGFAVGPADLRLKSEAGRYWLAEPTRIALLDGSLSIDDWSLTAPGTEAMEWTVDAVLTPVSMQRVTAALDWPTMQGKLSGVVPDIRYADGRMEVGGVLLIRIFDGTVKVRNVELQRPFGLVPRLQADIDVDSIDLEQLTGTFSFGEIEGRLSGHVHDLRMENWQPVAFEARLATPPGDDSRHRISQKAVDNLSSIGGGVGGALSRSFLGIFEEFPYDRLGIGCTLKNGVCAMDGLGSANGGYYLVKGRWLPPRINIIGYAEQVDWDTLVNRIQAATQGGTPEVE